MLTGEQVRLRPRDRADVERFYRWINDREVTRYLQAAYPISLADEERWFDGLTPNDFATGVGFSIDTKDGVHIGSLGLHDVEPEARTAVLGIMIGEKDYWSNGYGRDAIITLLRFGFGEMNLNRVSLHAFDFNDRAVACYTHCGFQIEGRLRDHHYGEGRYCDVIAMGVLRDEFEALHGLAAGRTEAPAL